MRTPNNTVIAPPKGWSVTLENAGPPIVSNNWDEFILLIGRRLKSNGADIHGWKEAAIDLMCRQRPEIESTDDTAPEPSRTMDGSDLLRFLKIMWAMKESDSPPVSEERQNKRVETCLACPKLGRIACFVGCGTTSEILSKFVLGRSVRRLPEIHKKSCLACGCYVEVKTMYPLDVLRKVDESSGTKPDYHLNCWVLTEEA